MKNYKKIIITLVAVLACLSFISYKLKDNKKRSQDDIVFSQRKIDKIPVMVENIKMGMLSENVVAAGTLEASEVLNLVSETQGKIVKIYKKKGSMVGVGDVIVKVDDEVITANVLTAEANYAKNEKDFERLTRLSEDNAITKRDLEQASIGLKKAKADLITANKALSNTSIKAPISGYLNNDNLTVGQLLGPGSPICEIVNNSILRLNIRISEHEVYKIIKGQKVIIRLSVFPDQSFTGNITAIAEKADAAMKFNTEITLVNNQKVHLKSGLYAEAELPVKNNERILIDKECIVGSMECPVVYVAVNGKAVKRTLITGQSNDKQVEILKGLLINEQIIISGQLNLKDGDEIDIKK